MLVVRIFGGGYDINGNWKNKIVAYEQVREKNGLILCNYLLKEDVKKLFNGRYNANSHTLTTFDTRDEIIHRLEKYQQETGETVIHIFDI